MDVILLKEVNDNFRNNHAEKALSQYKLLFEKKYFEEVSFFNYFYILNKKKSANEVFRSVCEYRIKNPDSKVANLINNYLNKRDSFDCDRPFLSIVVPIYNSGKYLEKCISSILEQRFQNFELILVNDGSTDNSKEIIEFYKEKDSRIIVIENHVASGNPGTPRNQALEICKGLYIGFVDSDDWIDDEYYQLLVDKAKVEFSDIVFASGFKNHLKTGEFNLRKYDNAGFNDPVSTRFKTHDSFMIWDKIFHSRLLRSFNIKLGETKAAVDVPFIFKAYYYCVSASFVDNNFGYNYRRESDSSVTVAHRKNSNCDFEFESYKSVLDWSSATQVTDYYKDLINIKLVNSLLYTLKLVGDEYFFGFLNRLKSAFRTVNDENFKQFCINNKKWWLYKEFQAARDFEPDEVKKYFDNKKAEIAEKEYINKTQVKFELKGSRKGILFFPAWVTNNPYQKLLYRAVNELFDLSVLGFSKEALCIRLLDEKRKDFEYIHFHWLHAFVDFSNDSDAEKLIELMSYAKEIGYKLIYTAHNIISHDSEFVEQEIRLRKRICSLFDYVFAHGVKAKEILVDTISIEQKKIHILPHGSYEDFYGNVIEKQQARNKLCLDQHATVFLFFGNIKGYKGVDRLLDAFERVYKVNQNATLIIAGRVIDSRSKEMIDKFRAHPGIKFHTDFIPDSMVKFFFSAADYAVLPFKRILTSGSAVLSLSFQCPVIAPNDGVLPELIRDGMGYLFNSYEEMTEIMLGQSIIHNRSKSTDLLSFNSNYSWRHCLENVYEIFRQ